MKHTKGPWKKHAELPIVEAANSRNIIADCGFSNREENNANARLIASAPELLNTLQAVALSLRAHPDNLPNSEFEVMLCRATDVIEKATGE